MGHVRMGWVFLIAVVIAGVGLAVTAAVTVAGRTIGLAGWLVPPIAACLAAGVQAVFQAATERPPPPGWPPRPRRGVPAAVAIVLVVLVVGVGGTGAALGIRYGIGWLTGNEPQVGQERLAATPGPSGKSGHVKVTVTVTSVVNTAHFTRVRLSVANQEKVSAMLNLFHNCVLTAGGVTLAADPFKSKWTEEVPPESAQQGSVTFSGHLPDGQVTGQLSFNMVFVFGRSGPDDAIVIRPIRLRGP
jgi:hypothetical protein